MRRRRSRRHQHSQRIDRALLLILCGVLTVGCAVIALRYLSPSLFKASRDREPSREAVEASRDHFLAVQQDALRSIENRPVYPYSVVPGGVKDAHELKWAAEHDPVVASHYAGFDYDHARIVQLVLARTVYVSYRIGNKIYWTRHINDNGIVATMVPDIARLERPARAPCSSAGPCCGPWPSAAPPPCGTC